MPQPKQKSLNRLMLQVEEFNKNHKIGDVVQARQTTTSEWQDVTINHPATILGGHTAVGWFNELKGCHNLDFVREKPSK